MFALSLSRFCPNTAPASSHNAAAVHHAVKFGFNVDLVRITRLALWSRLQKESGETNLTGCAYVQYGAFRMDTLQPLTERQRMILDFIKQSIRERGYPPSLREIGSHMGIKSTNGVNDHLTALERKGYLRRDSMKSRALQPTEMIDRPSASAKPEPAVSLDSESTPANEDGTVRVEVKGTVAAGGLNELYESSRGAFTMDRAMLGTPASAEVFALEVQGDSMIDAGIHEGDTVFVRRTTDARKGDIVVARVNGTGTLKRFYPEKDQVRLQPENKKYSPIIVPKARMEQSEFAIVGVVTGLFRKI